MCVCGGGGGGGVGWDMAIIKPDSTGALDGGGGGPVLHVDFKKAQCRPVEFKKCPCPMSLSLYISCRMSLRPKMPHVALSILGV